MPNSNYLTEEEKRRRQQQQQAQMSPNNPAMALDGNFMRQSASGVVNSWATPTPTTGATGTTPETTKPTLSEQAINSYTNKVQSLYDYEAQQRASADANFQKSMRYLPQMFKQAGLHGSGQSESTLADMANQQRNTQNAITAETNKGIMDLQQQYNADVENLDEQTKTQVDEVANYISQRDWSNASKGEWDNFINYIKSADYSDDVINKAIKQIQAFNPDAGRQLEKLSASTSSNSTLQSIKEGELSKIIIPANNPKKVGWSGQLSVNYNGKQAILGARSKVDDNIQEELTNLANDNGIEIKAGTVLYKGGKLYIYSGQDDKGWRNATVMAGTILSDLKKLN